MAAAPALLQLLQVLLQQGLFVTAHLAGATARKMWESHNGNMVTIWWFPKIGLPPTSSILDFPEHKPSIWVGGTIDL